MTHVFMSPVLLYRPFHAPSLQPLMSLPTANLQGSKSHSRRGPYSPERFPFDISLGQHPENPRIHRNLFAIAHHINLVLSEFFDVLPLARFQKSIDQPQRLVIAQIAIRTDGAFASHRHLLRFGIQYNVLVPRHSHHALHEQGIAGNRTRPPHDIGQGLGRSKQHHVPPFRPFLHPRQLFHKQHVPLRQRRVHARARYRVEGNEVPSDQREGEGRQGQGDAQEHRGGVASERGDEAREGGGGIESRKGRLGKQSRLDFHGPFRGSSHAASLPELLLQPPTAGS
mmetsp:Transcript_33079/g.67515  ORF Transcript_33079/g.67515 Transcript_33079/m.67515 type:complete len:283 (-) Transcript_33079:246-1094(-)